MEELTFGQKRRCFIQTFGYDRTQGSKEPHREGCYSIDFTAKLLESSLSLQPSVMTQCRSPTSQPQQLQLLLFAMSLYFFLFISWIIMNIMVPCPLLPTKAEPRGVQIPNIPNAHASVVLIN